MLLHYLPQKFICVFRWGEGGFCKLDQQIFGKRSRLPTSAAHGPRWWKPLHLCPWWHPLMVLTQAHAHRQTRISASINIFILHFYVVAKVKREWCNLVLILFYSVSERLPAHIFSVGFSVFYTCLYFTLSQTKNSKWTIRWQTQTVNAGYKKGELRAL